MAVNCIKKLRGESAKPGQKKNESPTKAGHKAFSHKALLGGRMAAKTSFTVKRSGPPAKEPGTFSVSGLLYVKILVVGRNGEFLRCLLNVCFLNVCICKTKSKTCFDLMSPTCPYCM